MNIKLFSFPTFEGWLKKKNVSIILGDYRCDIAAFFYYPKYNDIRYCKLAVSLKDKDPLNVYTENIFSISFKTNGNMEDLKSWYNSSIAEFNEFWKDYIRSNYLEWLNL